MSEPVWKPTPVVVIGATDALRFAKAIGELLVHRQTHPEASLALMQLAQLRRLLRPDPTEES